MMRLSVAVFLFAFALMLDSSFGDTSTLQPPRETPLVELAADQVPMDGVSKTGASALRIVPAKWKVAGTPNFYIHFRRMTEARKVAREVEFNLAFIARQLGAKPEDYARKSHVYVFEDLGEWSQFVAEAGVPDWTASFAFGDELFLNVRGQNGAPFDSQTLARETTHAIVSRIYKNRRWPLWLNEGFAEYMGSASVAERKNQTVKRLQRDLGKMADMPLGELVALREYPSDPKEVSRLYRTGEKLVRFLMTSGTPEQFVAFANTLIAGRTIEEAIPEIYPAAFPDFAKFTDSFAKYSGGKR